MCHQVKCRHSDGEVPFGLITPVIILLYADDLFVTGIDGLIADTKRKLATEFEVKDLSMMIIF